MSTINNQISTASLQNDEISLKRIILNTQEWINYLRSRWLILLIAGVVGGCLGLIYANSKKASYTAELSFVLEEESSKGGSYGGLAGQLGLSLGGDGVGAFQGENLLALMKSRLLIEKTLLTTVNVAGTNKTLAEFYIEINNLREEWKDEPELLSVRYLPNADKSKFTLVQNSLINGFHRSIVGTNLTIDNQDKESNILSIKVTSPNEMFSKLFTETLADEVSAFYKETKTKKATENVAILSHQADSIRRVLAYASRGAASALDANPNPNPARQGLYVPSQLKKFDVEMNQAILLQLIQNLESAKVSLRNETPLIQVIDRPILPLPKSSSSKARTLVIAVFLGVALASFLLIVIRGWKMIMAEGAV